MSEQTETKTDPVAELAEVLLLALYPEIRVDTMKRTHTWTEYQTLARAAIEHLKPKTEPRKRRTLYSTNGEDFIHECEYSAANELWASDKLELGHHYTIYSAVFEQHRSSDFLPYIPEELEERAYEECGDYAEDYTFKSEEAEATQEAIKAFIDNLIPCRLWRSFTETQTQLIRFTHENGDWERINVEGEEETR